MSPDKIVLGLTLYAWVSFVAAFGSLLLISVYWYGMNNLGALAEIITSGITFLV